MSIVDAPPAAGAVAAAFRLPGRAGALHPVSGAWSNRVFRLTVGSETYAVKEMLNPWEDASWADWLAEAWAFEQRAIAAGVAAPEPIPNPADGSCLAAVERRGDGGEAVVRVHRWIEGHPAPLVSASESLARWSGETLALLHRLGERPARREVFPILNIDNAKRWASLIDAADRAPAPWGHLMHTAAPCVAAIAELAEASGYRPDEEVMTHGDIDQKNVVIDPAGPHLCDWDVAAPLIPRREVADVAMSMAAWKRFDIAQTVVHSYRSAGGQLEHLSAADLGQPMMIGIDWIVLNVERALQLRPVNDEDAALGSRLVPGLLTQLPRRLVVAQRIHELLK